MANFSLIFNINVYYILFNMLDVINQFFTKLENFHIFQNRGYRLRSFDIFKSYKIAKEIFYSISCRNFFELSNGI